MAPISAKKDHDDEISPCIRVIQSITKPGQWVGLSTIQP